MEDKVILYSGTTKKNYSKCAYIKDCAVYYDKSKEPKTKHQELYKTQELSEAVIHAILTAKKTYSSPLVMICHENRHTASDISTEPIKVEGAYLVSEGIKWKTMNPYSVNLEDLLNLIEPEGFLKNQKNH